ncbi:MAG: branched-chain amino acid transport system II carrier protein, partial [Lactobacillus iners]|nr:branched-chain amino acid transport system II carrier protein [Lactobacillus iners]
AWSTPFLMFLYPLSMVLIVLSIMTPVIKKSRIVYFTTVVFTVIPAFLDFVNALPDVARNTSLVQSLITVRNTLPLSSVGVSWLLPAIIGLVLGLVIYFTKQKR